jgi:hypothetical protein
MAFWRKGEPRNFQRVKLLYRALTPLKAFLLVYGSDTSRASLLYAHHSGLSHKRESPGSSRESIKQSAPSTTSYIRFHP